MKTNNPDYIKNTSPIHECTKSTFVNGCCIHTILEEMKDKVILFKENEEIELREQIWWRELHFKTSNIIIPIMQKPRNFNFTFQNKTITKYIIGLEEFEEEIKNLNFYLPCYKDIDGKICYFTENYKNTFYSKDYITEIFEYPYSILTEGDFEKAKRRCCFGANKKIDLETLNFKLYYPNEIELPHFFLSNTNRTLLFDDLSMFIGNDNNNNIFYFTGPCSSGKTMSLLLYQKCFSKYKIGYFNIKVLLNAGEKDRIDRIHYECCNFFSQFDEFKKFAVELNSITFTYRNLFEILIYFYR